jgi:hypothetical protein
LGILDAERQSKFREDIMDDEKKRQDWYSYIFQRMTDKLIEPDSYFRFAENKTTFITFNYDRSLEHFLHESLKNSFSHAGAKEIIRVVKQIKIHHVYGKDKEEGTLEYLPPDRDPYGNAYVTLQSFAKNLRIVHERNNTDFAAIRRAIIEANIFPWFWLHEV